MQFFSFFGSFLVAAWVVLVLAACSEHKNAAAPIYVPPADTATNDSTDANKALRFLALGDSYTIGQSVTAAERFPAQTTILLREQGLHVEEPVYIAATGWTTQNLLTAIANEKPAPGYDIVTLLIGVNDEYQGRDSASYRAGFTQCLAQALTLAAQKTNHVFVLSIPDYSVTPFAAYRDTAAIRKRLDMFNEINRSVSADYGVAYLYITSYTREAGSDASLLATDGLHPSGKEYAVWAGALAPVIAGQFK